MFKKRSMLMGSAGILALAVSNSAFAAYGVIDNPPLVSPPVTGPYSVGGATQVSLRAVTLNGFADGAMFVIKPASTTIIGAASWVYDPSNPGAYKMIGFGPLDNPDYQYASSPNFAYNAPVNVANSNTGFYTVNNVGDAIGETMRYYSGTSTGQVAIGQDAWVYQHTSTTMGVGSGLLLPTLVAPTTTLPDSNYSGTTNTYFYFQPTGAAAGRMVRNSTALVLNNTGSVLGLVTRYSGLSVAATFGVDAFVNIGGVDTLLGLGVSNTNIGSAGQYYNFYNVNATIFGTNRTTSLINANASGPNIQAPGLKSLNDSNVVVGMQARYQANTGAQSSVGTDAWMFNYNNSGATVQIGLTGVASAGPSVTVNNGATTINTMYAFNSPIGTTGNTFLSQASTLTAFNNASQVAGVTTLFNSVTGNNNGNVAWVYTPSTTPGTASGFGPSAAGSYRQIGLTDSVGGTPSNTNMGHTPLSGSQSQNIFGLSDSGKAMGFTSRYNNSSATSFGIDAWYFDGTNPTVNASPWSSTLAGLKVYHGSGAPISLTTAFGTSGSITAPTTTSSATTFAGLANYFSSTGVANAVPTAMNAAGTMFGGQLSRFNATGGSISSATDGYVYDASKNMGFILMSPTATAPGDSAQFFIRSVTDDGVVAGTYTSYQTGTTTISGYYIFAWSEALGYFNVDQIVSGTSTIVTGLNNELAGDPGWVSLVNFAPTNANTGLFMDAAGNIYGTGNTTLATTFSNAVFEIVVPEPSSLALLGLGGLMLARRGRRGQTR